MKLLKKYTNRRIYDTETSQFVTLAEIRQMVLDRQPFRVVHAKTDADLTRSVLLQIITELEAEGHESLLTNRVLEELIRFYDDKMVALISPQLEKVILQSLALQDQLREQFTRAFTLPYGAPEQVFQQMAEQYQAFTEAFKAGAPAAGTAGPANPGQKKDEPGD
jgi:polyhydroxyalkanoate synthesis repressor PhaR